MDVLIPCDPGAAQACAQEASEFLTVKATGEEYVLASGEQKQVFQAAWRAQTALDYLLILARDVTTKDLKKDAWPETPFWNESFAIKCEGFTHNHEENEEWGGPVKEATGLTVNLSKPQVKIVPFNTGKEVLLTLSLVGKELRKRDYRVFTSNMSLRPTLAAAALRLAGYSGAEKLLVAYEDDGTLSIEASLLATKKSPFQYTGLAFSHWFKSKPEDSIEGSVDVVVPTVPFLKAVQKNAKIAGTHKNIIVTKAELDWLDTKYDEHSFDIVVAHLPCSGKKRSEKDVQKISQELSYQMEYVLKKTGSFTIISLKLDEHVSSFTKYKELARHELSMGGQTVGVIRYGL